MVVFPNAKINFGLNVVSKRVDGYHDIESIFYPIGINDALEITAKSSGDSEFRCHGKVIAGNVSDNLVMKAWVILQQKYQLPSVSINLIKNIPMGGGIGGGSADCGFFINLVNDYFGLGIGIKDREELAAELGSDCPFFIRNVPVYVSGRGENLDPISSFLTGYYLVLVYGGLHVSTKEAYAGITPSHSGQYLWELIGEPAESWKNTIKNDFEEVVFKTHPSLKIIKDQLYNNGAIYASLTGTGSCLYGLYRRKPSPNLEIAKKICWEGWL